MKTADTLLAEMAPGFDRVAERTRGLLAKIHGASGTGRVRLTADDVDAKLLAYAVRFVNERLPDRGTDWAALIAADPALAEAPVSPDPSGNRPATIGAAIRNAVLAALDPLVTAAAVEIERREFSGFAVDDLLDAARDAVRDLSGRDAAARALARRIEDTALRAGDDDLARHLAPLLDAARAGCADRRLARCLGECLHAVHEGHLDRAPPRAPTL